ncbi:MAG: dockerin type I domain-containing protein, partial [Planctomycetota bacterium]
TTLQGGRFDQVGLIDSLGATRDSVTPTFETEALIATVPMVAVGSGVVSLQAQYPDDTPDEVLLYGADAVIEEASTQVVGTELTVFRDYHNQTSVFDVDASGTVTPLDALLIINALNRYNSEISIPVADPSGLNPNYFYNVNADEFISARDALNVINELNRNPSQPNAEGEAALAVGLDRSSDDEFESVDEAISMLF